MKMILTRITTSQGSFEPYLVVDLCFMENQDNDQDELLIYNIIVFLLIQEIKTLDDKISSIQE